MTTRQAIAAAIRRWRKTPSVTTDGRPSPSTKPTVGRILVIEDDAATRHAMVEALRDHDFDVISANDGFLALRLASIGHPDLIVLDLGLPVLDGTSFLARMRNCRGVTEECVPVVVVSGRPDARLAAGAAGAAAFLEKPLDLLTLVGVIRELLRSRPPGLRIA